MDSGDIGKSPLIEMEIDTGDSPLIIQKPYDTLSKLQLEDDFRKNMFNQIEKGNLIEGQLFLIRKNILKRHIIDGEHTYETIVIPRTLIQQILQMAHDELGQNGTHRTYILL